MHTKVSNPTCLYLGVQLHHYPISVHGLRMLHSVSDVPRSLLVYQSSALGPSISRQLSLKLNTYLLWRAAPDPGAKQGYGRMRCEEFAEESSCAATGA